MTQEPPPIYVTWRTAAARYAEGASVESAQGERRRLMKKGHHIEVKQGWVHWEQFRRALEADAAPLAQKTQTALAARELFGAKARRQRSRGRESTT